MNKTLRFLLQLFFWLVIWLILWSQQLWETSFITHNAFVIIAQMVMIAMVIYCLTPIFLYKRKHFLFILFSLVLLMALSFIAIKLPLREIPLENMPPPPMHPEMGGRPPSSGLFMMFLLLLTSYSIAIVIEILLFAQKKEEEIIISKNENLQTELKLLKLQINPHFLFNSLNNIYALSVIDSTKTQQSISYLSDMLRYVLYECEHALVPLHKEMDYIKNYIKLFSLKNSKPYPIDIKYTIENKDTLIAPMLLISFVENAIKHSNIERITNTFIKLELTESKTDIHFKIINTIGSSTINKDEIGGIGLENVKKRLSIIYPKNHFLEIKNDDNCFSVDLKLNKNV